MHKIVLKMMIISIESSEINVFSESYVSPVLTTTLTVCRRNRGDPSSVYMVRYKYYKKNKVVLVWPGAVHVPIAV